MSRKDLMLSLFQDDLFRMSFLSSEALEIIFELGFLNCVLHCSFVMPLMCILMPARSYFLASTATLWHSGNTADNVV